MKRKHIMRGLAFVLIFMLLLAALGPVLRPAYPFGSVALEDPATIDYILLGDSESTTGVYPMELWRDYGFAGYNCGKAGQRLQDLYYLLRDLLEEYSPKVILLETNLFYRNRGYVGECEEVFNSLLGQALPAFHYHDRWKQLLAGEEQGRDLFRGAAFTEKVQPYGGGDYAQPTEEVQPVPFFQRIYADKIAALCREKGIQLILYSIPSPVNWSSAIHNGLEDYAEARGLIFLDLNLMQEQLGLDWSRDSFDAGDHLNCYGARKVTACLGRYLSERGSLDGHRGETGYERWEEELPAYLDATHQSSES